MKEELETQTPLDIWPIYVVFNTVDEKLTKGEVLYYGTVHREACEFARGRGWYDSDALIEMHKALNINGKLYLLQSDEPIEIGEVQSTIRARALAKLTFEEKRALGL